MTEINGLPAHILLVHGIVVLVPLTAVFLLFCVFWAAARRRLVWPTVILAFISMVLTPITTDAGEWLERNLPRTPLIREHAQMGDTLLPWTIGLFLISAAVAFLHVREGRQGRTHAVEQPAPVAVPADGPASAEAAAVTTAVTAAVTTTAVTPAAKPTWERVAAIALPVLAVVVAAGSLVQVYRIGDSGAQAVWAGFTPTATSSQPGG